MNSKQAARFAERVLEQNCDESEFEIAIEASELEIVADALRALGCSVTIIRTKSWLKVGCPENLRTRRP